MKPETYCPVWAIVGFENELFQVYYVPYFSDYKEHLTSFNPVVPKLGDAPSKGGVWGL